MPIFKQFFKTWREKDQAEGLGRVYVTERIAKIKQEVFDASKLHESNQMAAQYNMVDNGTGKTQVTICIQEIRDCISSIVLAFGIAEDEHLTVKITLKLKLERKAAEWFLLLKIVVTFTAVQWNAVILRCHHADFGNRLVQPDLMAIHTYFTRWLIRMNLYEWPRPNHAPKPTCHWGLDKLHERGRTNSYKLALVKYVRIAVR